MVITYDESITKKNKESFFNTGCFVEKEIKREIAQSWKRSKQLQLNREITYNKIYSIPKGNNPPVTKESVLLRDFILTNVVSQIYASLDATNGVLFYANDNGIVFSQRGNKEMLQYFNSFNIGIGTCVKEEYIGTTALSLITKLNEETWVIGEEHYLDIFTPYVSYCFYTEELNQRTYTLIFLPKEELSDMYPSYIHICKKYRKSTIENYQKELELYMMNETFDQLIKENNKAILMLDSLGNIINVNDTFINWFQTERSAIKNIPSLKIFPELKEAISCLQTGEKILFKEIIFPNAPTNKKFMRMDVTPMTKNEKISGLLIILTDSKILRQKMDKMANSQAYYIFDNILGKSSVMKDIKKDAMNAARSISSVIITGESGTGKELFAQAIHNGSPRRNQPFVVVNCATLQPELIASELFGYVEGAFTGAKKAGSMGKFEYAHKGTIFLDEIGELPLFAQTMFLRVLEERSVTRVGSNISTPVDFRLICATNRDLKRMVKSGTFRSDLYYRINVIHLHLPSLRERISDIPLFINYYINYFNELLGKRVERVSDDALSKLIGYSWPGNLRELRNTVECSMNKVKGDILQYNDLPIDILESSYCGKPEKLHQRTRRETSFCIEERKKIVELLIKHNGNKSRVADELGIARSTLYRKLKDYKLT